MAEVMRCRVMLRGMIGDMVRTMVRAEAGVGTGRQCQV